MANQMKSILSVCLALSVSTIFIDGVDGGACNWIPYCNNCTYDAGTQRATCHECDRFFEKTTVNGFSKCVKCPDNCESCSIRGYDKCDKCSQGFVISDGTVCIRACETTHCKICSATQTCTECESGYALDSEAQCLGVDEGACNWIVYCNNCTYDAGTERATCHQCDPLFEKTTVDGFSRCLKCPDNCESCATGYDKCDKCMQGFVTSDGTVCERACDTTHCTICSASQECTECESGYILDSDAQCLDLN